MLSATSYLSLKDSRGCAAGSGAVVKPMNSLISAITRDIAAASQILRVRVQLA
jgi:hypothetical protein